MTIRTTKFAAFFILSLVFTAVAHANFVPKTKLCDGMTVTNCALAAKKAITDSASPEEALQAWGAWAEAYEKAYRALADAPEPSSELDRIEDKIADKIDQYTNPASVATNLVIKQYFPLLASILEFADGPVVLVVTGIVSPAPLQTPIQELKATNDDLGKLLLEKLSPVLKFNWRTLYSTTVQEAFSGPVVQKP
jgi:hypothetical protein